MVHGRFSRRIRHQRGRQTGCAEGNAPLNGGGGMLVWAISASSIAGRPRAGHRRHQREHLAVLDTSPVGIAGRQRHGLHRFLQQVERGAAGGRTRGRVGRRRRWQNDLAGKAGGNDRRRVRQRLRLDSEAAGVAVSLASSGASAGDAVSGVPCTDGNGDRAAERTIAGARPRLLRSPLPPQACPAARRSDAAPCSAGAAHRCRRQRRRELHDGRRRGRGALRRCHRRWGGAERRHCRWHASALRRRHAAARSSAPGAARSAPP